LSLAVLSLRAKAPKAEFRVPSMLSLRLRYPKAELLKAVVLASSA
jgi:hypothetical protein